MEMPNPKRSMLWDLEIQLSTEEHYLAIPVRPFSFKTILHLFQRFRQEGARNLTVPGVAGTFGTVIMNFGTITALAGPNTTTSTEAIAETPQSSPRREQCKPERLLCQ